MALYLYINGPSQIMIGNAAYCGKHKRKGLAIGHDYENIHFYWRFTVLSLQS